MLDAKPVSVTRCMHSRYKVQKMLSEPGQKSNTLYESTSDAFGDLMDLLAHELNQPLAAILANAQAALRLMDRGVPDLKELREIFNDVVADDRRATEMIGNVRSAFKRSAAERKPIPLNDLIGEIIPDLRNNALAADIAIDLDLGQSLPLIEGDRGRLRQVMVNLVVNAFAAIHASGRPGELILRTRRDGSDVVLDVVDSGTGIPADKLDAIFKPFVTTRQDALGMGLPLSRSIVTRHNGRLWAENNANGGATFHVALPAEINPKTAPAAEVDRGSRIEAAGRPHGLTVLVADDNESFRHAVALILAELPELKFIAEAADGAEAVKKASELKPDLILLDVGLPIVDGVEAAAKIRTVAPDAKLLFLTQHESRDFVEAAMRAGAAGYVLKMDVGSELLQASLAVLRGEQYLSSGIRPR